MTITQQEIIALAVESGCVKIDWIKVNAAFLQRFANLAYQRGAALEREACAQMCESRSTPGTGSVAILNGAASAIRARSAE